MLMRILFVAAFISASPILRAQSNTDSALQAVIERLDRLEKQNRELLTEVQELRRQLGGPAQSASADASPPAGSSPPPPAERLDVQESRTEELAQTKVGTSQRMPVSLTGMVLFNAFHNGGFGGGTEVPASAQLAKSSDASGATFRQTVIGLTFNGPDLPGGGKASGNAYFDFWGGSAAPSNNLFRVRTATLDLAWKNTTISAGQDKPIVSPREPTSLAEVGLAPLVGAGNLWDWQPQLRIEQRYSFRNSDPNGNETGLKLQAGIFETSEVYSSTAPAALSGTLEKQRPAYEARLLFYRGIPGKRRVEIAPGVHASTTHVAGQSVDSRLGTLDWLIQPANRISLTGAFFQGTDDSGLGGLRQGFTLLSSGAAIPVHAAGGWSQLAVTLAPRLSLHIFGGEESDRPSDLTPNSVRRNLVYAANAMYKLAPNVIAALETSQTRTDYILSGTRINNHYDLALAYLF